MKAAKIKTVLFDMDGTMFDTERLWLKIFRNVLDEMGLPGPAELYQNVIGMTGDPVSRYLTDAFRLDTPAKQEQFSRLCQLHREKTFVRGRIQLKKGLLELLDYLQKRDIPWAIVTSSELWEVQRYFVSCDLTYRPRIIVSAESVTRCKPAPDPFLTASEQLGIPPAECLVLEDSPLGIQAAAMAGMQAIMIPDLIMPTEIERQQTLQIATDMTQVIRFLEKFG